MKRKFLLSALFLLLACSIAYAESKPVLMMLSTKTCPACKQMQKVLKQLNKQYPGIKTRHIYLEDGNNMKYVDMYDIEYVPTLVFKDENGEDFDVRVGYMPVDKVVKIFKNAGVKVN